MNSSHTFSVSEVLPDGRVLVTVYVRIGDQIHVVMDAFDDATMTSGKRYLDVHLDNGEKPTPIRRN
jgi:hypothetical protein